MTKLKKIGALILAVAMLATMGVAFAESVNSDGTLNVDKGIDSNKTTINIAKRIVFVNSEGTTVREPNIEYTYTISAVTDPGSATITDKDGITGTVKAGILAAVKGSATATTSKVTFTDTSTSSASSTGTETASKYAAFMFDATKFKVSDVLTPGIYRYKITEATNVTKASVGIVPASDYQADRYLDVYVKWNAARTALEVYGYVLYEGEANQTIRSKQLTPAGDVSMKSIGYVDTDINATDTVHKDVDVYTTQNLYINKTTTGSMADKNNNFPITLTLTAPSGVSNVKLDVTTSANGTLTTATDAVGAHVPTWGAVNGTVRDSSQIAIKGIPAGATYSIVETNNTPDSYKVKAGATSGAADLLSEAIVIAENNSSATTTVVLSEKREIFITNTLDAISPTGYVTRFAPYALILIGGIALLLISRKHKKHTDEE